jgi:hypothetical protein
VTFTFFFPAAFIDAERVDTELVFAIDEDSRLIDDACVAQKATRKMCE